MKVNVQIAPLQNQSTTDLPLQYQIYISGIGTKQECKFIENKIIDTNTKLEILEIADIVKQLQKKITMLKQNL